MLYTSFIFFYIPYIKKFFWPSLCSSCLSIFQSIMQVRNSFIPSSLKAALKAPSPSLQVRAAGFVQVLRVGSCFYRTSCASEICPGVMYRICMVRMVCKVQTGKLIKSNIQMLA